MNKELKRGKISLDDDKYIKSNFLDQTPEQIGKAINRAPATVEKRIKELGLRQSALDDDEYNRLLTVLYSRPYWPEVKAQFPDKKHLSEQKYFEASWVNTMSEFGSDVRYQEELDIKHAITLDIRLNQISRLQTQNQEDIDRLRLQLEEEYRMPLDSRDMMKIARLETAQSSNKSAAATYHSTYVKLLDERKNIIKLLKLDRERRSNLVEDSEQTFFSYIKKLQDSKFRQKMGREIELQKIAADKVRQQLQDDHQYGDESFDKPLLTPEDK